VNVVVFVYEIRTYTRDKRSHIFQASMTPLLLHALRLLLLLQLRKFLTSTPTPVNTPKTSK